MSSLDLRVRRLRLRHCTVRRHPRVCIQSRPKFFASVEIHFGEIDTRKLPRLNPLRQLRHRQVVDFLAGHADPKASSLLVSLPQAQQVSSPAPPAASNTTPAHRRSPTGTPASDPAAAAPTYTIFVCPFSVLRKV